MAFNVKTFRTRALTAIIFAIIMLGGLLWNQWSFLVLFSIVHFGCWWEYLLLTEKIHQSKIHRHVKLGLMLMGYGLMLWFCGSIYRINGYGVSENISLPFSIAGFVILVMGVVQSKTIKMKAIGMAFLGFLYVSVSLGLMIRLSNFVFDTSTGEHLFATHNMEYPCLVVFSLWINDTMAYIVGSLIGKTPLSKISPKKTWEGTAGGVILTGLIAFIVPLFIEFKMIGSDTAILVACSCAVIGTIGDLFESKLKRMANVKDSGSFMPGHGGFLDRFDSILFAVYPAAVLLTPCLFGPC